MSSTDPGTVISVLVWTLSLATLLVASGVPVWVLVDWQLERAHAANPWER